MGSGKEQNTSLRIEWLKHKLSWQRKVGYFVLFQVLTLIIIFSSLEIVVYKGKMRVAESLTASVHNSLVTHDNRRVIEALNNSGSGEFQSIEVTYPLINEKWFVLNRGEGIWRIYCAVPLYFEDMGKKPFALLKFGYTLGGVWKEAFLVWSILVLMSFLFMSLLQKISERENQATLKENHAQMLEQIARQVSHDIRSPLTALNVVLTQLQSLPEDRRTMLRSSVQRINDIANDLIERGKRDVQGLVANSIKDNRVKGVQKISVTTLVDMLVSEKRIQLRDNPGVQIESDLKESYGVFIECNSSEIRRALSNIMNNAVESYENREGLVLVAVRNYKDKVSLIIKDGGKGIPNQILSQIGTKGFSYGKKSCGSGSGLGVFQAKAAVESFKGEFQITSQEGRGTIVTMTFPKVHAPEWFVEILRVKTKQTVVTVDDDTSIHMIWQGRFKSLGAEEKGIQLIHFYSGAEFKKWVTERGNTKNLSDENLTAERLVTGENEAVYLIDYELGGQAQTGAEIIRELNLADQSVLVTSRFEEPHLINEINQARIKMIPKTLAGLVPIHIGE